MATLNSFVVQHFIHHPEHSSSGLWNQQHQKKMQASMACSPHVHGVNPLQSHTNHLLQTTLRLKPPYYAFTLPRSPSGITLSCNSQPQPLLNLCPPRVCSSNAGPLRCGISSNTYGGKEDRCVGKWLVVASEVLSAAFPLWVSIGCVVGLMKPSYFNWVTPKFTIVGLNIIMLGMGMTLSLDDLRGALSMHKQVLYAFALQYSVSIFTKLLFGVWSLHTITTIINLILQQHFIITALLTC